MISTPDPLADPSLWPHQRRGLAEFAAAVLAGVRCMVLTSPTGGGKSRMMYAIIRWALSRGEGVVLYTNRKMLRRQIGRQLSAAGIEHGVRASGERADFGRRVQLSSVQTEHRRVYKAEKWSLHDAGVVLIDEAHANARGTAERIIRDHLAAGAVVVLVTATPFGLGHVAERIIVAGTNSELRACGAHVPCKTFAPDEPSLDKIKPTATGEYVEDDVRKVIMTPTVFARVFESWKQLNPRGLPTIGFGPGVKESLWFAEEFSRHGVPAAHIDGDNCWVDGRLFTGKEAIEARDRVEAASKDGRIQVVWNRFVMREGLDWPWVSHIVMATIFGTPTSYLQAGGRGMRAYPGKDHFVLQDHGGNFFRHGSLNNDREWRLDDTPRVATEIRKQDFAEKKAPEPIVCVKCKYVRASGPACPQCGHSSNVRSRFVVQLDGSLKEVRGDRVPRRKRLKKANTADLWRKVYFGARKKGGEATFLQLENRFRHKYGYLPPRDLPLMPQNDHDWMKRVRHVETKALR